MENLGSLNLENALTSDPTRRTIVGPLLNILAGYRNAEENEGTFNSTLWTPLLNTLLLPDLASLQVSLFCSNELKLSHIAGWNRKLRVDYAVCTEDLPPLVLVEYAVDCNGRAVSKDFAKNAIIGASLFLDYYGKSRSCLDVLDRIHMILMYISDTEAEVAMLRPVLDAEKILKGFSLTTQTEWRFDLHRASENRAPEAAPPPRAPKLATRPKSNSTFNISEEQITPIIASINVALSGVRLPDMDSETRILKVSEKFDLSNVNMITLKTLRGLGLHINGLVDVLGASHRASFQPGDPEDPVYCYSEALQSSDYVQAIPENVTPAKQRNTTYSLFTTPNTAGGARKRQRKPSARLIKKTGNSCASWSSLQGCPSTFCLR